MRKPAAACLFLGFSVAVSAAPHLNIDSISGEYHRAVDGALVSGEVYKTEDHLLVVPLPRGRAYVETVINFYNGHQCGLGVIAKVSGDALVYGGHGHDDGCVLTLRRAGGQIVFNDPDHKCSDNYCGARGSFDGQSFSVQLRKPIRDLKKIQQSISYRDALDEEQGKP